MAFIDSLQEVFRSAACAASMAGNALLSLLPVGADGSVMTKLRRVDQQKQLVWCGRDPYTSPFRPGLCDYLYNVTITYRIQNHPIAQFNQTYTTGGQFYGPIGRATIKITEADAPGGRQILQVVLRQHGGFGTSRTELPFDFEFPNQEFHADADGFILNVEAVPVDAQADEQCGGTGPIVPYRPEDHTYTFKPTVNINPTLNVKPVLNVVIAPFFIDANLNLQMPVTVNVNPVANINLNVPLNIKGTLNWNTGDVNIEFDPSAPGGSDDSPSNPAPDGPGTRPDKPAPPKPPSVPDAEPDPEDAAARRTIIGAIVTVGGDSALGGETVIFQDENPNIYAPSLGYISFAIRTATGSVGWTNDIPVKNLRSYIPCPVDFGAVQVKGTPRPGNSWEITPVYRSSLVLAGG